MLGPVDYVVVGFQGNMFDGSILDELGTAVKDRVIRIIDLLFIIKDRDGTIVEGELEDQSDDLRATFGDINFKDNEPLFTDEDIEKIGEQMEPDTAAGVLVVEHLWAKGLKQALNNAGGFLIADGRIHPEAVAAAVSDLDRIDTKT